MPAVDCPLALEAGLGQGDETHRAPHPGYAQPRLALTRAESSEDKTLPRGSERAGCELQQLAPGCACDLHRQKCWAFTFLLRWTPSPHDRPPWIVQAGPWGGSPIESAVVGQSLSCIRLFVTPWSAVCQASPSFTISQSLLKLTSTETVIPSNHLIPCHPLFLLPSIFPRIRVFSNESAVCIKWPKYWSFSFSISPSNEYSGLISFRIVWSDLVVQGTLKSLL